MTEEKVSIPIRIVDDCLVSPTILEKFLIRAGYNVTAVGNGREALSALTANFFRLLSPTG
jgi:CheY-like chemotaxis protein